MAVDIEEQYEKLNFIQSGFMLYLLIAVILFGLCWLGWKRSAVKGN